MFHFIAFILIQKYFGKLKYKLFSNHLKGRIMNLFRCNNFDPRVAEAVKRGDSTEVLQFLFSMNIIGQSTSVSKKDLGQMLYFKIAQTMQDLGGEPKICKSEGKSFGFTMTLREKKKVQAKLYTTWIFNYDIQLHLTVELIDPHATFLKPNPLVPVNDLVNQLNQECFLGTYFLNPTHPHLLCYRHRIRLADNIRFVPQDIAEVYSELSEQFTRFVCKLNLLLNCPQIKSDKLQARLVTLRHLRQQFQMKRFMREKAMKHFDLTNSTIKVIDEAIKIIGYQTRLAQYYKSGNAAMNLIKQKHCEQIYRSVREKIEKEAEQQKEKSKPEQIVKGIQIQEVIRETALNSGGFSLIYKGQYYVTLYPTINPQLFSKEQLRAQPRNRQILVKKTIGNQKIDQLCFDNEVSFLRYIRSQKHNRFAGYYLPKIKMQSLQLSASHSRHIFLNYYQRNLYEALRNMSQQQCFKACKQIIEAICFLVGKNLLHRDLKETNILVDDSGNIKFIDFGSACSIDTKDPNEVNFKPCNPDLMSTQGYYLPFNDVKASSPFIAKNYTREQYNKAETFDCYSFGTILRNCLSISKFGESMIERQLTYLVSKCQQSNPADRFTATEAQCYLFEIYQLFKVSSKLQEKVVRHGRNSTQQENLE